MMTRTRLSLLAALLTIIASCGAPSAAEKTLFQKASPFTLVTVTQSSDGLRYLRFGKDLAPQSAVVPGDPDHIEYQYAKAMPVALALVEEPKRALVVGLGGGTIPTFLHKHFPQLHIDVVDIDPVVVEVAREFFGFREADTLRVHVQDGRKFIEKCKEPYDIIFLDAYGSNNIPYDLATREFLQAVRRAVKPTGVVAANVWSGSCNPLYAAMRRTYQEVFDNLYVLELTSSSNEIFLALPRSGQIDRSKLAQAASRISTDKKFRFDMGRIVWLGLREANLRYPGAKVLLDRDKETGGK